jgi:excisionase family DNA binding protein
METLNLNLVERLRCTKSALSAQELAKILNCTARYILKSAKAGNIPCYRIGGMVRFDPVIVAEWLNTR